MTDCLFDYLAGALGSNLSPAGGAAWRKLLDAFMTVAGAEIERIDSGQ